MTSRKHITLNSLFFMENVLKLTYIFPYPVDKVFWKYSNWEALSRWWWPNGFSNTFHAFDFRTGGKWVFTMSDGNNDYLNEHIFHKIEKYHIIMEHVVPPIFTLEVLFESLWECETEMTWISTFESAEFLEKMQDFLIEKNVENFERLALELRNF